MIRKDDTSKRAFFIQKLRQWFGRHGRNYPWRKTENPYRVLISEYLLQQTNADLALPTYLRFIKDYRIKDLAGRYQTTA
jgi:A/G-specific adenine glycosylase